MGGSDRTADTLLPRGRLQGTVELPDEGAHGGVLDLEAVLS